MRIHGAGAASRREREDEGAGGGGGERRFVATSTEGKAGGGRRAGCEQEQWSAPLDASTTSPASRLRRGRPRKAEIDEELGEGRRKHREAEGRREGSSCQRRSSPVERVAVKGGDM